MKKITRKEFRKYYKTETSFSDLTGIPLDVEYQKKLEIMHKLYKHSKNDEEFNILLVEKGLINVIS